MEMCIPGDRFGAERVFPVNGQATNALLGYETQYKRRLVKNSFIPRSSFALRDL